jgi:putative transposase
MPRASRHFLPGYVWHITHRCHQRKFLLKFARDRRRYLHWVFEAKKRFALSVLNYVVTSNHIHLLVKDTGQDAIAQSMQLIAGRTAQEYNQRKGRGGAFWEDRYHATAIEADEHLHRCLVYIDLNMVRANEYRSPFKSFKPFNRYAPFKTFRISELSGLAELGEFQRAHQQWVEEALMVKTMRDNRWSEAIAVGSLPFVENVKAELGIKVLHRELEQFGGAYALREPSEPYAGDSGSENGTLRLKNTISWNQTAEAAET